MKIPNGQPAKLTEVEEKDVSCERENESRRLKELMMRLQTMMSLSEPEGNDWPKEAA
jgi:hypothetical protein